MRWVVLGWMLIGVFAALGPAAQIVVDKDLVRLSSGILSREIRIRGTEIQTVSMRIEGQEALAEPIPELRVTVRRAQPNRRPEGLRLGEGVPTNSVSTFRSDYREDSSRWEDRRPGAVRWVDPVELKSDRWANGAGQIERSILEPKPGVRRLVLRVPLHGEPSFGRLRVTLCYEVYDGHPAVRKWVEIENQGDGWIMLQRLAVDDLRLSAAFRTTVALTPAERGAESSVMAFGDAEGSQGLIAVSEIPSALRQMDQEGRMSYSERLFEWVLGPGERFVSEPVFVYAYSGAVRNTPSARSTPLDRAVEGPYMQFLRQHVGIAAEDAPILAPQWMTWAVFQNRIDDALVRSRAALAARAGFRQILLDDGWQRGRLGTEPDAQKFPDFRSTCQFIRSQGLALGLWVSCYRDPDSKDLRAVPEGRSLPIVTRLNGLAMSFSSPWRRYYAADLAGLSRELGVTYFKQDFSNIRFGDFAEGHESRSLRDSLLRSLRGLLEAQDAIRAAAPDVVTELTHEIYWGTPGVPCDVAALKHACQYHIPPNNCLGASPVSPGNYRNMAIDVATHRKALLLGCYEARQRFFAHRGLPLYCLEYYGAATHSIDGSLTSAIQDRQVVSFLLGAPLTFSGDLATLSDENLAHYRRRFDLLRRLEDQYGIYRHFQFSGVPAPTEVDWHWWGKLDESGHGAVIVVRGSGGAESRAINVPWTDRERRYRVTASMSNKDLGECMGGAELQDRGVVLSLPLFGQEILELAAADRVSTRAAVPPRHTFGHPAGKAITLLGYPSRSTVSVTHAVARMGLDSPILWRVPAALAGQLH